MECLPSPVTLGPQILRGRGGPVRDWEDWFNNHTQLNDSFRSAAQLVRMWWEYTGLPNPGECLCVHVIILLYSLSFVLWSCCSCVSIVGRECNIRCCYEQVIRSSRHHCRGFSATFSARRSVLVCVLPGSPIFSPHSGMRRRSSTFTCLGRMSRRWKQWRKGSSRWNVKNTCVSYYCSHDQIRHHSY